jgi:Fic family protein
LADLLLFEIDEQPGVPIDDAREVSRCVAAMAHGLQRLRGGLPLSLRLLREMHAVLLDQARGHGKAPGEFRRSQVWVGGTRPGNAVFVPPPADKLADCLDRFERFLHDQPEPRHRSSKRRWRMCSSRRFTRSSMATAASAAC